MDSRMDSILLIINDGPYGNERSYNGLRLALTAITGFSYFPLQIATYLGFICAGLSALAIPVVIGLRLAGSRVSGSKARHRIFSLRNC